MPPPPAERKSGRNSDWGHLFNRDIISMPDKWEYPWYAVWDLAFHMVTMAEIGNFIDLVRVRVRVRARVRVRTRVSVRVRSTLRSHSSSLKFLL